MTFSKMAYNDMGIDGGGSGPTSGYYDHLGYSVLLNTRDGFAPLNKRPTELKREIKYNGDLNNLIPCIELEKKLGNINDDIISHNELGGLINNYIINNHNGIPKGSNVVLIPQIPDGEENTNLWEWNTGQKTQNLDIIVNKSFAYRVTYTNANGIKSEQLFTLGVQGDCLPSKGIQSIYKNETLIGNSTANVNSGDSIKLELKVADVYGNIIWSNGDSSYSIFIPCINTSRNVTAIFTNYCGRKNIFIYQINLDK